MRHDERGKALSLLITMMIPAFLLLCALVVDGGGRLSAERSAETAAAQAARAGSAAEARGGQAAARQSAVDVLAAHGVVGTVTVSGSAVVVTTTVEYRTAFLPLIGVHSLYGHGMAEAGIVPRAP